MCSFNQVVRILSIVTMLSVAITAHSRPQSGTNVMESIQVSLLQEIPTSCAVVPIQEVFVIVPLDDVQHLVGKSDIYSLRAEILLGNRIENTSPFQGCIAFSLATPPDKPSSNSPAYLISYFIENGNAAIASNEGILYNSVNMHFLGIAGLKGDISFSLDGVRGSFLSLLWWIS